MDVNFRTLDLNLLRVFDEVMAERSLTRAARNLALTQPAVSNALRRLRETLGDELVRRAGPGVEPTPRALALWPVVRDSLRHLEHALVPAAFDPLEADQGFTVAMADATAAEVIPRTMHILQAEAPGLTLRVMPLTTRDPRRLLEEERIDLALGHFPAVMSDLTARAQDRAAQNFESQRLYAGDYVCVMRAAHPLARAPLDLDAYCQAHHLLVSFSGQPWGFVDEALAPLGRQRRIVLTVSQFFTAGRVVAESDLLSAMPRHFIHTLGVAGGLVERELPLAVPPVHVDALWHRRQQGSQAHRWLRETLARAATEAYAGVLQK